MQVLPDPPIHSSQDVEAPRHIELNSDLLFVNHSCDPNVAFEVPNGGEWCVRALKDVKAGEVSRVHWKREEEDDDDDDELILCDGWGGRL